MPKLHNFTCNIDKLETDFTWKNQWVLMLFTTNYNLDPTMHTPYHKNNILNQGSFINSTKIKMMNQFNISSLSCDDEIDNILRRNTKTFLLLFKMTGKTEKLPDKVVRLQMVLKHIHPSHT